MMWIHAAMAQKERDLIGERARAALAAAKARGRALGEGVSAGKGARRRRSRPGAAERAAHRLEVERLSGEGVVGHGSLQNLIPADVPFGRGDAMLRERARNKNRTIQRRSLLHQQQAA